MKASFVYLEFIAILLAGSYLPPAAPAVAMAVEADFLAADDQNLIDEWEQAKKPLKVEKRAAPAKQNFVVDLVAALGEAIAELTGSDIAPPPAEVLDIDPAPLEEQFKPHVEKMLHAELRFVQSVCKPTPDEFRTIKTAGDAAVKAAVKECAQTQAQLQQGFRRGQQPQMPDPRGILLTGMAKSVASTLPQDRAQVYQQELDKRAAAQKHAALLNLVAQLDQELVLSPEQRTQLTESLNANWQDIWGRQLEFFIYGGQYLPPLPAQRIVPFLNKTQQEIWTKLPKNDYVGWFGFGMVQQMDFIVDEVLVEEPKEADAVNAGGEKP